MSSEQPRRGREGGSGASPIGSTAAIVIAVIAVVGGFLILRQINDDDDGGSSVSVTTVDGGNDRHHRCPNRCPGGAGCHAHYGRGCLGCAQGPALLRALIEGGNRGRYLVFFRVHGHARGFPDAGDG